MNAVILFMLLGASILAVAVLYNITNINIFERRREIATLSVLGFTAGELKSLVFNENFFISAFGALLGIPLGSRITFSGMRYCVCRDVTPYSGGFELEIAAGVLAIRTDSFTSATGISITAETLVSFSPVFSSEAGGAGKRLRCPP